MEYNEYFCHFEPYYADAVIFWNQKSYRKHRYYE